MTEVKFQITREEGLDHIEIDGLSGRLGNIALPEINIHVSPHGIR